MTEGTVLRVSGLSFSWPQRHVLTQWSAQLGPGLTWLQGANGSGKSTLMQLLAGVLAPLAGTLQLRAADGRALEAALQPLDWKREVFWCGPGAPAFDHLSPAEYRAFLAGLYPRWEAQALAAHLDALALRPHLATRIAALSTGTQRKVWLAAALSAGTRVRLLDEPLNALDAAARDHLLACLARAAGDRGTVWLVASHQAPEVGTPTGNLSLDVSSNSGAGPRT
jgi:ABC-2 type transport system ATP-binding protein